MLNYTVIEKGSARTSDVVGHMNGNTEDLIQNFHYGGRGGEY